MSENKRISDFDQVSSIADEDEFILVDKSNTTDADSSDAGKTVKVSFADLKSSVGTQGQKGEPGADGESAYGSYYRTTTDLPMGLHDWVDSLKGSTGEKGQKGEPGTSSASLDSSTSSSSNVYLDRIPKRESACVSAQIMGSSYAYSVSAFEADGTPTNWMYQIEGCRVLDGFYKRYGTNYNYSDSISGEESRIMRLKEYGVFDFLCTTTSMPSSDRVDHEILFYDWYNNYIGRWDFYSSGSAYYIDLYDANENLVKTFNGSKYSGSESEWMVGSSGGGGRIAATFKLKDGMLKVFPYYTSTGMHPRYHGGSEMFTEDVTGWSTTHAAAIKVKFKTIRGTHPAAYAQLRVGNGYNSALHDGNGNSYSAGSLYVNSWRDTGEFTVY